jgi:hypothetical protein
MISEDNIVEYGYIFEGETGTIADNALGTIAQDGQLTPLFMVADYDSILYHNYNYFMVEIDSTIFQPGDSLTLYPMMRLRKPGEEWHIVPPTSIKTADAKTELDIYYDLLGRRINGVPQKNGVYIKGNRKTIINK